MERHIRYPELRDQVILVTGGASGIGAAHVELFGGNQARVAFIDKDVEAGRSLEAALRKKEMDVTFFPGDLMDIDRLKDIIDTVGNSLGPVFGLINNAGVDRRRSFADLSVEEFDWMINSNLRHAVFAAQSVIPHMKKLGKGSIVNTSSVTWMRGIAEVEAYSSAKAAIVGLTHSLAREVGPARIRVNTIVPGYITTVSQQDKTIEKQYLALQCLPDAVTPWDVAEAAVFLCSDAAKMITKQSLIINAGSL